MRKWPIAAAWEIGRRGFGWQLSYQLLAEEEDWREGPIIWAHEIPIHDRARSKMTKVGISLYTVAQ